MKIVLLGDILHEISKPVFLGNNKKKKEEEKYQSFVVCSICSKVNNTSPKIWTSISTWLSDVVSIMDWMANSVDPPDQTQQLFANKQTNYFTKFDGRG